MRCASWLSLTKPASIHSSIHSEQDLHTLLLQVHWPSPETEPSFAPPTRQHSLKDRLQLSALRSSLSSNSERWLDDAGDTRLEGTSPTTSDIARPSMGDITPLTSDFPLKGNVMEIRDDLASCMDLSSAKGRRRREYRPPVPTESTPENSEACTLATTPSHSTEFKQEGEGQRDGGGVRRELEEERQEETNNGSFTQAGAHGAFESRRGEGDDIAEAPKVRGDDVQQAQRRERDKNDAAEVVEGEKGSEECLLL